MAFKGYKLVRNWYSKFKLGIGILAGIAIILSTHAVFEYTSENKFCDICHVHPHVTQSWKESVHYKNESGNVVNCVQCHLPPDGLFHYTEKIRVGIRDIIGVIFKDPAKIDWEAKSRVEFAKKFTYDNSCTHCHVELFSLNLSKKGEDAHVYYFHQKANIRCINCHLNVGHFIEGAAEATVDLLEKSTAKKRITFPPKSRDNKFINYTETIPGTNIQFEMIAVAGGSFEMGSPESEIYRNNDEGPVRKIKLSPFWMGKTEVSWDEWDAYYLQNVSTYNNAKGLSKMDEITGPTPPYGSPDQGWGKGARPAITMTYHAAVKYCEWLSEITGDKYRLPTEAEWEYACRGGTNDPYFFDGEPSKYSKKSLKNKIFGADTSVINQFVWYNANSRFKNHPAYSKKVNPFGLENMLGNVKEFCQDWYAEDAYGQISNHQEIINPRGPNAGQEHVVRGGSFKSDAADVRCAARDYTKTQQWLLSDPQSPKSIWWYSDCTDVGFRVVREFDGEIVNNTD